MYKSSSSTPMGSSNAKSFPKAALKSLEKSGLLNEQGAFVPFSQQIEEEKYAKADQEFLEFSQAITRVE